MNKVEGSEGIQISSDLSIMHSQLVFFKSRVFHGVVEKLIVRHVDEIGPEHAAHASVADYEHVFVRIFRGCRI